MTHRHEERECPVCRQWYGVEVPERGGRVPVVCGDCERPWNVARRKAQRRKRATLAALDEAIAAAAGASWDGEASLRRLRRRLHKTPPRALAAAALELPWQPGSRQDARQVDLLATANEGQGSTAA